MLVLHSDCARRSKSAQFSGKLNVPVLWIYDAIIIIVGGPVWAKMQQPGFMPKPRLTFSDSGTSSPAIADANA